MYRLALVALSSTLLGIIVADVAVGADSADDGAFEDVRPDDQTSDRDAPAFPDAHFRARFGTPDEHLDGETDRETTGGGGSPSDQTNASQPPIDRTPSESESSAPEVDGADDSFENLDRALERDQGRESSAGGDRTSEGDSRDEESKPASSGSESDGSTSSPPASDPAERPTGNSVSAGASQPSSPADRPRAEGETPTGTTDSGAAPTAGESTDQTPSAAEEKTSDRSEAGAQRSDVRRCGRQPHDRLLELLNRTRRRQGLDPLPCDPRLNQSAQAHAAEMCRGDFLAHRGPGGSRPADRIAEAFGNDAVRGGGENVAAGQTSAEFVHEQWMKSRGHRANILRESFDSVGFGYAECDGRPRWVQNFAILP